MTQLSCMMGRGAMSTRAFGLVLAALSVVAPGTAVADTDVSEETRKCATAYEMTQRKQQRGELVDALESAERCARASCPDLLESECAKWASDLRPKLPTLVVRVRGSDGCTRRDARLEVTGSTRKHRDLDALLVDPGIHDVTVTDPTSGETKVQTINFASGERRDIDVDFASEGKVCPTSGVQTPIGRVSTLTLALGSAGAGLVIAGATMGLIGASKKGDLDACRPGCSRDEIDDVRTFFLAGDVLAGFGLLALGAAAATFFASDHKSAASAGPHLVVGAGGVVASF